MSARISNRLASIAALLLCVSFAAQGQAYSGYSPYSIFGVGDLSRQGTAYNRTMGGVGVGTRSNRFINIMNPAAVTARDSLAFMADFSLYGDNKVFTQNDIKSANNTFNINDCVISFPLWSTSAMMLGISPFSDTGFGYAYDYTDPDVIGRTGNISYSASGSGSLYKFFTAAGITFWDRLSLGAEFDYYFGNLTKSFSTAISDNSYNSITSTTTLQANAVGGKFGLQFEQPLGSKLKLIVGATYSTGADIKGYYDDLRLSGSSAAVDTLYHKMDTLGRTQKARIASEIGVGLSLRYADKWMVAFDYTRSDWRNSGIENISGFSYSSSPFATSLSESYRLGFELVPNRNDIRYYFNNVAYRAGAYYKKENFLLNGKQISSMGITLGATLPIYRWYNGLTLGVELGQRGSLSDGMIRERYVNFSIGVNIFDIWFQKAHYE
jgi:hypothetical protein